MDLMYILCLIDYGMLHLTLYLSMSKLGEAGETWHTHMNKKSLSLAAMYRIILHYMLHFHFDISQFLYGWQSGCLGLQTLSTPAAFEFDICSSLLTSVYNSILKWVNGSTLT